jgi:hypothetical protein
MAWCFIKFIVYLTTPTVAQTIWFPGRELTPNTKQEVIFAIIICLAVDLVHLQTNVTMYKLYRKRKAEYYFVLINK